MQWWRNKPVHRFLPVKNHKKKQPIKDISRSKNRPNLLKMLCYKEWTGEDL